MVVYARINHIGWVHLWLSPEDYLGGEASVHFFNSRTDPRWAELALTDAQRAGLEAGELVAMEDPGYLDTDPAGG